MESLPMPMITFFLIIGIASSIALVTGIYSRKKKGLEFDLLANSLYIRMAAAAIFGIVFGLWGIFARCQ